MPTATPTAKDASFLEAAAAACLVPLSFGLRVEDGGGGGMGFCSSSMLYMLGGGGRGGGKSVNSYFDTGTTGELDTTNSSVGIFEGTNNSVKLLDRFAETCSVMATPFTWSPCVNID